MTLIVVPKSDDFRWVPIYDVLATDDEGDRYHFRMQAQSVEVLMSYLRLNYKSIDVLAEVGSAAVRKAVAEDKLFELGVSRYLGESQWQQMVDQSRAYIEKTERLKSKRILELQ